MSLFTKPNQWIPRGLQRRILMCSIVVISIGTASAQDYEAVAKRLKKSVRKGEITQKHADAMMGALKKETAKGRTQSNRNVAAEDTWKKLQAMVSKGELTKEQAIARMSAIKKAAVKKEAGKKDAGADSAMAYLMKVKKELGAAVQAGEITREDAAKKFQATSAAVKKRLAAADRQTRVTQGKEAASKPDQARAYLMQVRTRLAQAVEAGKMSREDAEKKYKAAEAAVKKRVEMGNRREKAGDGSRTLRGRGDQAKTGKVTGKETASEWVEVKSETADEQRE